MGFTEWIRQYENQRVLMITALIVLVAAPFIKPIGLPVPITENTKMFYDRVESIKAGDVVVVDFNFAASNWGELGAGSVALLKQLIRKRAQINFKIIIMTTMEGGPFMLTRSVEQVGGWSKVNFGEYGKDWVNLGFMAGGEPMIAAMATNFNSIYKNDERGTPVTQIPLMVEMKDANDIDLVIHFNMGADSDKYRKQWGVPYNKPVLQIVQGIQVPTMVMYIKADQVHGIIGSIRGAAEYELLLRMPGEAVISTDALSMGHIIVFVAIILGNVSFHLAEKKRRGT